MAAIVLAHGSPGHRSALTNSVITFSKIRGADEPHPQKEFYLAQLESMLVGRMAKVTGMPKEKVEELFASEVQLSATEAIKLKIIDELANATGRPFP